MKKLWHQFIQVYLHEFRIIFRDQGIMIFLFFLPIAYPVIYSLIYNPELVRNVRMVVVDHDRTADSRELVRDLDACQEVWVIGYVPDMAAARKVMSDHECYGILEIPAGYAKKIGRGEQAHAVLYSDMSLLLRYRGFLVATTNVMSELGGKLMHRDLDTSLPLASTIMTEDPLPIANVNLGNLTGGFDSFIMVGLVVLILQQSVILAVGMAGGAKRERRGLIGYNPVNASRSTVITILGQSLCYITLLVLPIIWLLHYIPLVFQFPMAGNTLEIFCFILPVLLGSIMLGFCFQGIVGEREDVFVLWVVTSVVFLFLSGLTWPRYAIHGFWKVLSDLVPATWGVEGFVRMNANGASLSQVGEYYRNAWMLCGLYAVLAWFIQRFVVRPQALRVNPQPIPGDPETQGND